MGLLPLNFTDEATWENIVGNFRSKTKRINNKIDKYNLLVPILQKQMLHVKLEDIAKEVLSIPPQKVVKEHDSKKINSDVSVKKEGSLLGMISFIFNKKL